MIEEYRYIEGYEGLYKVSNLGNVYSVRSQKQLKKRIGTHGYEYVLLYNSNSLKYMLVHRLVATSFICNEDNRREVNHIDGDKTNNEVCNLEWVTHADNMRHAHNNNLVPNAVLTDSDVREIYNLAHSGLYTLQEIGNMYNTSKMNVSYIKNKKRWKHLLEQEE